MHFYIKDLTKENIKQLEKLKGSKFYPELDNVKKYTLFYIYDNEFTWRISCDIILDYCAPIMEFYQFKELMEYKGGNK